MTCVRGFHRYETYLNCVGHVGHKIFYKGKNVFYTDQILLKWVMFFTLVKNFYVGQTIYGGQSIYMGRGIRGMEASTLNMR